MAEWPSQRRSEYKDSEEMEFDIIDLSLPSVQQQKRYIHGWQEIQGCHMVRSRCYAYSLRLIHFMCIDSGGGVGGLTLAVALSKYPDIEVEVFEAARQFTEVGAGVGIWPRAFKVQNFSQKLVVHSLMVRRSCGSWARVSSMRL